MPLPMTVITVQQARVSPLRRHVRIPSSDLTTQAWWERQVDPSTSVRLLILEEAKTHGLVDRVNRIGFQPVNVPSAVPHQPVAPTGPTAVPNAPAATNGPTAVPNPPAQPAAGAAAAPSAPAPTALPFTLVPSAAAPGQPTALPDFRDMELELLRAELTVLRSMVSTPPLFNVA